MAHHVQGCHWAVPTLLMPRPYWLSAWDAPWSCWNTRAATVLMDTTACEACPLWRERRLPHCAEGAIPPAGAVALDAGR
jgi:hypothetical protein